MGCEKMFRVHISAVCKKIALREGALLPTVGGRRGARRAHRLVWRRALCGVGGENRYVDGKTPGARGSVLADVIHVLTSCALTRGVWHGRPCCPACRQRAAAGQGRRQRAVWAGGGAGAKRAALPLRESARGEARAGHARRLLRAGACTGLWGRGGRADDGDA